MRIPCSQVPSSLSLKWSLITLRYLRKVIKEWLHQIKLKPANTNSIMRRRRIFSWEQKFFVSSSLLIQKTPLLWTPLNKEATAM